MAKLAASHSVSMMEREELFLAACKQGDWTQFHKFLLQVLYPPPLTYRSFFLQGVDINCKAGQALRESITNNHPLLVPPIILTSPKRSLSRSLNC